MLKKFNLFTCVMFIWFIGIIGVGCGSTGDSIFGYNADGTKKEGGSTAATVAAMTTPLVPWASLATGLGGAIYGLFRGKKYKAAGHSVVDAIDHYVRNKEKYPEFNQLSMEKLLEILEKRQKEAGTIKTVNKLRTKPAKLNVVNAS